MRNQVLLTFLHPTSKPLISDSNYAFVHIDDSYVIRKRFDILCTSILSLESGAKQVMVDAYGLHLPVRAMHFIVKEAAQ